MGPAHLAKLVFSDDLDFVQQLQRFDQRDTTLMDGLGIIINQHARTVVDGTVDDLAQELSSIYLLYMHRLPHLLMGILGTTEMFHIALGIAIDCSTTRSAEHVACV